MTLDEAHGPGRPAAAYDAIDILWFGGPEQALDALLGPLAEDAGWWLAGASGGSERLLARPHRVR